MAFKRFVFLIVFCGVVIHGLLVNDDSREDEVVLRQRRLDKSRSGEISLRRGDSLERESRTDGARREGVSRRFSQQETRRDARLESIERRSEADLRRADVQLERRVEGFRREGPPESRLQSKLDRRSEDGNSLERREEQRFQFETRDVRQSGDIRERRRNNDDNVREITERKERVDVRSVQRHVEDFVRRIEIGKRQSETNRRVENTPRRQSDDNDLERVGENRREGRQNNNNRRYRDEPSDRQTLRSENVGGEHVIRDESRRVLRRDHLSDDIRGSRRVVRQEDVRQVLRDSGRRDSLRDEVQSLRRADQVEARREVEDIRQFRRREVRDEDQDSRRVNRRDQERARRDVRRDELRLRNSARFDQRRQEVGENRDRFVRGDLRRKEEMRGNIQSDARLFRRGENTRDGAETRVESRESRRVSRSRDPEQDEVRDARIVRSGPREFRRETRNEVTRRDATRDDMENRRVFARQQSKRDENRDEIQEPRREESKRDLEFTRRNSIRGSRREGSEDLKRDNTRRNDVEALRRIETNRRIRRASGDDESRRVYDRRQVTAERLTERQQLVQEELRRNSGEDESRFGNSETERQTLRRTERLDVFEKDNSRRVTMPNYPKVNRRESLELNRENFEVKELDPRTDYRLKMKQEKFGIWGFLDSLPFETSAKFGDFLSQAVVGSMTVFMILQQRNAKVVN